MVAQSIRVADNGLAMIKRSDPIGLIIAVVMYCMAT